MISECAFRTPDQNERTAPVFGAKVKMNCLCNLFDNEVLWLVIIALLILNSTCNGCGGASRPFGGCGCNG